MSEVNPQRKQIDQELMGFENYNAYLRYTKSLFELEPEEYEALFKVLLKLQSVGQKPIDILHQCKHRQGDDDCVDMLKFMMYINDMDITDIKESL
jgi:hypothetical protein